jgi:hypothetical protein
MMLRNHHAVAAMEGWLSVINQTEKYQHFPRNLIA